MDEWVGFIQSLIWIEEKYESLHVVFPPEEQIYFHDILFCYNVAALLEVHKAIWYAYLHFHAFI